MTTTRNPTVASRITPRLSTPPYRLVKVTGPEDQEIPVVGRLAALRGDQSALLLAVDDLVAAWSELAGRPGDDLVSRDLARLRTALAARTVGVGVFGLVNRGKSTLVNALVGAEVSATRVVPETALPVEVRFAPEVGARLHLADGSVREATPEVARVCSSRRAPPADRRHVIMVEQRVPAPVLRQGLRLIDTPGLDEAEADQLYTRRTLQHLERVDAGIVVLQAPPTVGATEMRFLKDLLRRCGAKVVVVCNLYPEYFRDDAQRDAVTGYVRERLGQAGGGDLHLVPVCALDAWRARVEGDEDAFEASGAGRLLSVVEAIATTQARPGTVDESAAELRRIADEALRWLRARREVLEGGRPETPPGDAADEVGLLTDSVRQAVVAIQDHFEASVLQAGHTAGRQLEGAGDGDEMRAVLDRLRLDLEVRADNAATALTRRLAPVARRLHLDGGDRRQQRAVHDTDALVVSGSGPEAPGVGAALGGLVTGGVGLAVMGLAVAPVGLIAGAVAGWRVSRLLRGGSSRRALREHAQARVGEITDETVVAFRRATTGMAEGLLGLVRERREAAEETRQRLLVPVARLTGGERQRALARCDELVGRLERLRLETGLTSERSAMLAELTSLS